MAALLLRQKKKPVTSMVTGFFRCISLFPQKLIETVRTHTHRIWNTTSTPRHSLLCL